MDQFEYDPAVGIFMPPKPRKYALGPNPTSEPPREPHWDRDLEVIGRRIGRTLRFYWMKEMRCWGIQQLERTGLYETVFCNYDEEKQWDLQRERKPAPSWYPEYPYRPIDQRCLDEFCASDLKQTEATGDLDKDRKRRDARVAEAAIARKAKSDAHQAELIENVIAGGDIKRFDRLQAHEAFHGGPGVKFTEYFQVSSKAPVGK